MYMPAALNYTGKRNMLSCFRQQADISDMAKGLPPVDPMSAVNALRSGMSGFWPEWMVSKMNPEYLETEQKNNILTQALMAIGLVEPEDLNPSTVMPSNRAPLSPQTLPMLTSPTQWGDAGQQEAYAQSDRQYLSDLEYQKFRANNSVNPYGESNDESSATLKASNANTVIYVIAGLAAAYFVTKHFANRR